MTAQNTDEELMLAYQDNSAQAFETLYQRYNKRIYTFIYAKVKDRQTAEDVFQKVFIKLHKSKHRYNQDIPFNKWIFTICQSELIDWFRKSSKEKLDFDQNQIIDSSISETPKPPLDIIDTGDLNPEELRLIKYRYQADLDFQEIAEKLGLSQVTVRKRISRLIKKLQLKHGVR